MLPLRKRLESSEQENKSLYATRLNEMTNINPVLLYVLGSISLLACGTQSQKIVIPELDLAFDADTIRMSQEAEQYIETAVDLMRKNALYKKEIDFEQIHQAIRFYADGAEVASDTHLAIDKALPLLKDHHSSFLTPEVLTQALGLNEDDIENIKQGRPPHIDPTKIQGLASTLNFAQGKVVNESIGYLSVPSFEKLYAEEMTFFADSLQNIIKTLDARNVSGWIIDVRDNDGGADMPMIAGLGSLLDEENSYYGIDESGTIRTQSYYQDGAYYNLESQTDSFAIPIVKTTTNYALSNPKLPIVVLTSRKTASSAEAVVAIFQGQENVTVVGERTNGLTTVNSFNFLEDNAVLNLTMAHYADRDKNPLIQGISPDVEIMPSQESESDVVMQRALELLVTE